MKALIQEAERLSDAAHGLCFAEPVTHVYNPLRYAWRPHRRYLENARHGVRALFMGMNPGPWGMAQTGVPFGEVGLVREWLGIDEPVDKPEREHPKRPIQGFQCARSEVSGRRLWGLFRDRFGQPEAFFKDHFVLNYCPLVFMGETGRNITPDKLKAVERGKLEELCDRHLEAAVIAMEPGCLVGVGAFAENCFRRVVGERLPVYRVLHPSPASPAANKDWAGTATRQLEEAGIW